MTPHNNLRRDERNGRTDQGIPKEAGPEIHLAPASWLQGKANTDQAASENARSRAAN
jgi:hypothetical protein